MEFRTRSKNPYWERIVEMSVVRDSKKILGLENAGVCKLIFLHKGSAVFSGDFISGQVCSPALILFNHTMTASVTGKFTADILYFTPAVLNDKLTNEVMTNDEMRNVLSLTDSQDAILLDDFYREDKHKIIALKEQDRYILTMLMSNMYNELVLQNDGYWPCRSRSFFSQLLFVIGNLSRSAESNPEEVIAEVISFMSSHVNEKITLGRLSKEFGINRNALSEIFIEKTGKTTIQYLIEMRLKLGAAMLRETEIPILEIAERTGFCDATNFSRGFKSAYNLTPSQYRKTNKGSVN